MNGALYDIIFTPLDKLTFSKLRSELVARAEGKTLEIGIGTGRNLPFYHSEIALTGLDPDTSMLSRVEGKKHPVNSQFVTGDAEQLSFADQEFDTVLATLVFCSIPDPDQALAEVWRVLKDGGQFLLIEHVRKNTPIMGRLQDQLTPIWKRLFDGCHLDRDPEAKILELGFQLVEHRILWNGLGKLWILSKPWKDQ
jgi:ubiquinone/menaquinone biosynthesis C-methylase UbiE